jgi:hypothetical protein
VCTALVSKGRELDFPVVINSESLKDTHNMRFDSARSEIARAAFNFNLAKKHRSEGIIAFLEFVH